MVGKSSGKTRFQTRGGGGGWAEENRDAKHAYERTVLKLAQLRWASHNIIFL